MILQEVEDRVEIELLYLRLLESIYYGSNNPEFLASQKELFIITLCCVSIPVGKGEFLKHPNSA